MSQDTGNEAADQTASAPNKPDDVTMKCDQAIVNYVHEAIITIKSLKQQCNISRIFSYLKEKIPDNEKIIKLTEKGLIKQLDLAVKEGILSRKYGSSANGDSNKISSKSHHSHKTSNIIKLPPRDGVSKSEDQVILNSNLISINHI